MRIMIGHIHQLVLGTSNPKGEIFAILKDPGCHPLHLVLHVRRELLDPEIIAITYKDVTVLIDSDAMRFAEVATHCALSFCEIAEAPDQVPIICKKCDAMILSVREQNVARVCNRNLVWHVKFNPDSLG